ncbi:MAG: type II secretion system protein N [Pseudomonas sp.]
MFGTRSLGVEDAPPPVTRLRLSLHGSFLHTDPQRSSAIVQREGQPAQRYAIGAEIDDGIRLYAVHRERIELQRNGQLEILRFTPSNQAQTSQGLDSGAPVPQDEAPDDAALDPHERIPENNAALLRERMDALRQQMEAAGTLPDTDSTD